MAFHIVFGVINFGGFGVQGTQGTQGTQWTQWTVTRAMAFNFFGLFAFNVF